MKEVDYFREQARECRNNAAKAADRLDRRALRQLADHYDKEAGKLETGAMKIMH